YRALSSINGKSFIASSLVNRIAMIDSLVSLKLVVIRFIKASTARSLGFAEHGINGWVTVFVKGILCNWMVSLGVVSAMVSTSVSGKIMAMWLPIFIFFALVFEHAVVNMYLFPLGMMLGADFTIMDWLVWNQIPVTLGNLIGGLLVTGLSLYVTHGKTLPLRQRK
ncbi:formate/nitrite transporter family protein, partial [Vibrio cincinnatiensis]